MHQQRFFAKPLPYSVAVLPDTPICAFGSSSLHILATSIFDCHQTCCLNFVGKRIKLKLGLVSPYTQEYFPVALMMAPAKRRPFVSSAKPSVTIIVALWRTQAASHQIVDRLKDMMRPLHGKVAVATAASRDYA